MGWDGRGGSISGLTLSFLCLCLCCGAQDR